MGLAHPPAWLPAAQSDTAVLLLPGVNSAPACAAADASTQHCSLWPVAQAATRSIEQSWFGFGFGFGFRARARGKKERGWDGLGSAGVGVRREKGEGGGRGEDASKGEGGG